MIERGPNPWTVCALEFSIEKAVLGFNSTSLLILSYFIHTGWKDSCSLDHLPSTGQPPPHLPTSLELSGKNFACPPPQRFPLCRVTRVPSICEAEDTDTCDRGVSSMATESKGLHGSNSAWCWHLLCSILRFISEVPGPAQEKEKDPLSLQSAAIKTITHKKRTA